MINTYVQLYITRNLCALRWNFVKSCTDSNSAFCCMFTNVFVGMHVVLQDTQLNAYPWIEIYDGSLIKYMAPLEMHDRFFVPEAIAAESDQTATGTAAESATEASDGDGGDG